MFVSYFQKRTVTIEPRSTVLLPITFTPKIRSRTETWRQNSLKTKYKRKWLSKAAAADLADLIESGGVDSSLSSDLHHVQTELHIHTSRGRKVALIKGSALKVNPYRLPNEIIFYKDGFVSCGEFLAEQDRLNYLASDDRVPSFTYDLHIRNPWEHSPILLNEIYTSCPDLIQLSYQHNGQNRFNNCGSSPNEVSECNTPHFQDIHGPPVVPTGTNMYYLVTLSLNLNVQNITIDESGTTELGELRILSNNSTFAITIRYTTADVDRSDRHYVGNNMTQNKSSEQVKNITPIQFQKNGVKLLDCDPLSDEGSIKVDISPYFNKELNQSQSMTDNYLISPNNLDFGLLTKYGESKSIGISITNRGERKVRLMRHKVSLNVESMDSEGSRKDVVLLPMDERKIDHFALRALVDIQDKDQTIRQGATVNDVASLSLTSVFMPGQNDTFPIVCQGSVLLHFGPVNMSYNDWKNSVIKDPFESQKNVVEISFIVRIMYGNLQYNLKSVYFPSMRASFYALKKGEEDENRQCAEGFHRKIQITHSFPETLHLTGLKIQSLKSDSHINECQKLFEIHDFEGSKKNRRYSFLSSAKSGDSWGVITLRYYYAPYSSKVIRAKKCVLVLETDLAGVFNVPLRIYSAFTKIESDLVVAPLECQTLDNTIQTTDLGCFQKSLSNIDKNVSLDKSGKKIKSDLTQGYIHRLTKSLKDENDDRSMISRPIFLSLGALPASATETYSIYVKNYNPVPIIVKAVVSAIEGMKVRLARTPSRISDYILNADGQIKGELHQSNEWLKQILLKSEIPQDFLESFVACDDIALLRDVSDGMEKLFYEHARLRFYPRKTGLFYNETHRSNSVKSYPPPFQTPEPSNSSNGSDHFLLIGNKRFDLKKEVGNQPNWIIPPGGVAKLELLIKSPPLELLSDDDISEVFSSGLVLLSNFGEIVPIFASYHALSGRFKITSSESVSNVTDLHTVRSPPVFRSRYHTNFDSSKNDDSAQQSFLIENNFTNDVIIRRIYSCNRWIQIDLHDNSTERSITRPLVVQSGQSVLASVHSTIHCSQKDTGLAHPSFFHCVLEWLKDRNFLNVEECGNSNKIGGDYQSGVDMAQFNKAKEVEQSIKRATQAFSRAVAYLNKQYNNSRMSVLSYTNIPFEASEVFNQAFTQWKMLCKIGQNVVTGSAQVEFDFKATSQRNVTPVGIAQMITSMLESLTLSTSLEIPRLLNIRSELLRNHSSIQRNNYIDFGITSISKASELFIPIRNPTGTAIRVRLAVCNECWSQGESEVFVQSQASSKHPWWTGGSFFLPNEKGDLLISNHNVTIETPGGSSLSLMNPSLHSSTAFTRGCFGRRCGGSFAEKNAQNDQVLKVSPIGGSSSVHGSLSGRSYDTNGKNERVENRGSSSNQYPPFALSSKSLVEVTVPPFSRKSIGPVYFRPTSRNHFRASVWLENSLTGLERIQLRGSGGLEKIVFLETNDIGVIGGSIETRFNKPTLMFKRMAAEPYGPLLRNVLVANLGEIPVKVDGFHLSDAQVTVHETHRQDEHDKCKKRGFQILDCARKENDNAESSNSKSFTLKPKEAKHLRLLYNSDCSFGSFYVNLVVKFAQDNFHKKKDLELLLGHHLSPNDINVCTTHMHYRHRTQYNHKKGFVQISSLILPLLILAVIMIDIIYTVYHRRVSSTEFHEKAARTGEKPGSKNWIEDFRCLSRGEHDSADLISLGKEHTRHYLLAQYRKESMLPPHCILQNGALNTERNLFNSNSTETNVQTRSSTSESQATPTSRRSTSTVAKTLSETVFMYAHCFRKSNLHSHDEGIELLVPHGLDWKRAVRSGIAQWANRSTRRLSKANNSNKTGMIPRKRILKDQKHTEYATQTQKEKKLEFQNKNFPPIHEQKVTKKEEKSPRSDLQREHAQLHHAASSTNGSPDKNVKTNFNNGVAPELHGVNFSTTQIDKDFNERGGQISTDSAVK